MGYFCKAPGCSERAASNYGEYCHSHRARRRRHGAANQEAITKADLKGYRKLVRDRIERNKDKELWSKLRTLWEGVVEEAQGVVEQSRKGFAMASYKRTTAVELVKLGHAVDPQDVIETVLAMYLLQDQEPRKIKGDLAFLTQMVRRVRGLTVLNAGSWTGSTGRTKVAYRDLNPKAVEGMGMKLAIALGAAGLTLAKLERRDHEKKQKELIEYHRALEDLR